MLMRTLSALWVAWPRVAFFAAMLGASFLSVYLLVVSIQVKGDVRALVLGTRA